MIAAYTTYDADGFQRAVRYPFLFTGFSCCYLYDKDLVKDDNININLFVFNIFYSIARGQKIPIFSAAGLPHNDVS